MVGTEPDAEAGTLSRNRNTLSKSRNTSPTILPLPREPVKHDNRVARKHVSERIVEARGVAVEPDSMDEASSLPSVPAFMPAPLPFIAVLPELFDLILRFFSTALESKTASLRKSKKCTTPSSQMAWGLCLEPDVVLWRKFLTITRNYFLSTIFCGSSISRVSRLFAPRVKPFFGIDRFFQLSRPFGILTAR